MSIANARKEQIHHPFSTPPVALRVKELFEEFVGLDPDSSVEQNSNGEIVITPPTGGESSSLNAVLTFQLRTWSKQFGGVTFDSSVILCLPDCSKRSPDASWIFAARCSALSAEDRRKFAPISHNFVIDLLSESDRFNELQLKCRT